MRQVKRLFQPKSTKFRTLIHFELRKQFASEWLALSEKDKEAARSFLNECREDIARFLETIK